MVRFCIFGLLLTAPTCLCAQSLTWLGVLSGYSQSSALSVSADGSVVVGGYFNTFGNYRAFRWTRQSGIRDLGTFGGSYSIAIDVSADGSVVVGEAQNASGTYYPFRWTQSGGLQNLGTLPNYTARGSAWSVSADGNVVVGVVENNNRGAMGFRWTPTSGMQSIGTLGGSWSAAYAISPNGRFIAGESQNSASAARAFLRLENGSMIDLGLPPNGFRASANGVSNDGSVVIGLLLRTDIPGHRAFRWTSQTGMQDLGTLGGSGALALDVSADGSIIVGWSFDSSGDYRAFRWTPQSGMQNLNTVYANLLTDGSILRGARGISTDGRYIVGWGRNNRSGRNWEAFLLDTWLTGDTNGDGCVDDADLLNVLLSFGTQGRAPTRHEDINKDGVVDDADLLLVLFNFGNGCPR